ncbi:MAG: transcriptional regulator GutM [Propionicimonas sp.]
MVWQFAALLVGAMVLSIALSLWQHRIYLAEVNRLAKAHAGEDLRLVSGRSKGRLQGAVVVLLIDPNTRNIEAASAMVGATIFTRLRPAPELCGPMDTVADRATAKHTRKAALSALEMLPAGLRPAPQPAAADSERTRIRLPRPTTSI